MRYTAFNCCFQFILRRYNMDDQDLGEARGTIVAIAASLGGAVQVEPINTRVESAYVLKALEV
jgi:hypothetical protein